MLPKIKTNRIKTEIMYLKGVSYTRLANIVLSFVLNVFVCTAGEKKKKKKKKMIYIYIYFLGFTPLFFRDNFFYFFLFLRNMFKDKVVAGDLRKLLQKVPDSYGLPHTPIS